MMKIVEDKVKKRVWEKPLVLELPIKQTYGGLSPNPAEGSFSGPTGS